MLHAIPTMFKNIKSVKGSSIQASHLFRLFLLLILFVVGGLFRVILFLLLSLFDLAQSFPLFRESVCLSLVIGDNNVVKNCARLHLPQIKAEESEVCIAVHRIVVDVLWVGDLLGFPNSLVGWIGNALSVPISLVSWIVLHWSLPLSILFIIPVIWFLSFVVHNALLFNPIVWL